MTVKARLLTSLAIGAAMGLANSLANVVGGPYAPHPLRPDGVWALQLLAAVLGTKWAWAATALVCGWQARQWWHSPVFGILGLWCADLLYYLSDWLGGVTGQLAVRELLWWAAIGLGAGAVMGLLAGLTHIGASWSIIPALIAAAALWWLRQFSGADVVRQASYTAQTALTIAGLVAVTAWWAMRRRSRAHSPHAVSEPDPA